MTTAHRDWLAGAAAAIAGPALIGLLLGLGDGPLPAARNAAIVASLVVGLTLIMAPALYIVSSLAGNAPPASAFAGAVGSGMRSTGLALLGLAAPTAFLMATSFSQTVAWLFGGAALLCGCAVGFYSLYPRLFAPNQLRGWLTFGGWSFTTICIGANIFIKVVLT